MDDGLAAWLRLSLTPGVSAATQRLLLARFGLPEQIFAAGRSAISQAAGHEVAGLLLAAPNQAAIEAALAWAAEDGNHILTLADAEYPRPLLEISDPPPLLYAKGTLSALAGDALAMVGARSATPQGVANAEAFARALAQTGLAIVSGLALGIDTAAHRGALSGSGPTIAVIGTGADRVYPSGNRDLAHEIVATGLILSEFPLGTPPIGHNFPRRNRLIAGLSRGVLVVEAAVGSGSLITARLASECGREVFAIPGSIHSPLSRGCHRLIREGAKLVETAQDILEELGAATPPRPIARRERRPRRDQPGAQSQALPLGPADDDSRKLLDTLGHDPVDIDTLAARSGLTVDALYAILLPLELDGHVARLPGSRFQRL